MSSLPCPRLRLRAKLRSVFIKLIMSRKPVSIYDSVTSKDFVTEIYPKREPTVLRGINIGACIHEWTPEYLSQKLRDTKVKVHVSTNKQLNFINKNFTYRTLPFDEFVRRASEEIHTEYFFSPDEVYYLRSLGEDARKDIADISQQFPQLASDFCLPLLFDKDRFFSSVFRIGSKGMQLWTHYDVMDNLLVGVAGRKRVVLYSPQQVDYMYMVGDKSSVVHIEDFDAEKFPLFSQAASVECILEPGDILFIPALWLHNVTSLEFSISVNVFWKHLDHDCYDNRDTYGNKDPKVMSRCMQMMDKIVKALHELPPEYCDFYARILSNNLRDRSCIIDQPPA